MASSIQGSTEYYNNCSMLTAFVPLSTFSALFLRIFQTSATWDSSSRNGRQRSGSGLDSRLLSGHPCHRADSRAQNWLQDPQPGQSGRHPGWPQHRGDCWRLHHDRYVGWRRLHQWHRRNCGDKRPCVVPSAHWICRQPGLRRAILYRQDAKERLHYPSGPFPSEVWQGDELPPLPSRSHRRSLLVCCHLGYSRRYAEGDSGHRPQPVHSHLGRHRFAVHAARGPLLRGLHRHRTAHLHFRRSGGGCAVRHEARGSDVDRRGHQLAGHSGYLLHRQLHRPVSSSHLWRHSLAGVLAASPVGKVCCCRSQSVCSRRAWLFDPGCPSRSPRSRGCHCRLEQDGVRPAQPGPHRCPADAAAGVLPPDAGGGVVRGSGRHLGRSHVVHRLVLLVGLQHVCLQRLRRPAPAVRGTATFGDADSVGDAGGSDCHRGDVLWAGPHRDVSLRPVGAVLRPCLRHPVPAVDLRAVRPLEQYVRLADGLRPRPSLPVAGGRTEARPAGHHSFPMVRFRERPEVSLPDFGHVYLPYLPRDRLGHRQTSLPTGCLATRYGRLPLLPTGPRV